MSQTRLPSERGQGAIWVDMGNAQTGRLVTPGPRAVGDIGGREPYRKDFGSCFRALVATAAIAALQTACGGLPPQPNIRKEISEGMKGLGVVPFYPLREAPRIGELRLVDISRSDLSNVPTYVPTNVLLSDDLVPEFDAARKRTAALVSRFPKSPADLATELAPSGDKIAFYKQPPDAASGNEGAGAAPSPTPTQSTAAAQASQPTAGTQPTAGVPSAAAAAPSSHTARTPAARPAATAKPKVQRPATSAPPTPMPAELTLEGLASYKLASVQEFAVAGAWQKFLGAFGLRKTRSLEIEAEGVEVADLPLNQVLASIRQACHDVRGPLGSANLLLVQEGYDILNHYRDAVISQLQESSSNGPVNIKPVNPQIYLLWKVYYLRGIRYIWNDSDATAALLEATANVGATSGGAPSTINTVTVAAPPPATATGDVKTLETEIQTLQARLDSLTKAIAGGGAALTYAGATLRGIEFISAFDRPLAFGYEPIAWNALKQLKKGDPDPNTGQPAKEDMVVFDRGLRKLCSETGVEP
jgi:hypothetical protein